MFYAESGKGRGLLNFVIGLASALNLHRLDCDWLSLSFD
jgi:hypothetical protein